MPRNTETPNDAFLNQSCTVNPSGRSKLRRRLARLPFFLALSSRSRTPHVRSQTRQNNFDVLRLILATWVLLGHFNVLTGWGRQSFWFHLHGFSVEAFFVISGYMVTASYERHKTLFSYLPRRIFRIYPLYIVVIIAQSLLMALILNTRESVNLLHQLTKYLFFNLILLNFIKPQMGSLFDHEAIHAINPSLWTLKIEIVFYLLLPFFVECKRRLGLLVILGLIAASITYFYLVQNFDDGRFAKQLPGQLRFFLLGMIVHYVSHYLFLLKRWGILITILSFVLCVTAGASVLGPACYPLAVATFVFAAGALTPVIRVRLDISYGVYLLHAPVIQILLITVGMNYPLTLFFSSVIITFIMATLVALAIEQPFIALGAKLGNLADLQESTDPPNPAAHNANPSSTATVNPPVAKKIPD